MNHFIINNSPFQTPLAFFFLLSLIQTKIHCLQYVFLLGELRKRRINVEKSVFVEVQVPSTSVTNCP